MLHPDDVAACVERWTRSLTTGEPYDFQLRLLRAQDRRFRWHHARTMPQHDETGRVVQWFGTNTDIDAERRLLDDQQILLDASKLLDTSVDYDRTLRKLADFCAPRLADWCVLDQVDELGAPHRIALTHRDPGRLLLLQAL